MALHVLATIASERIASCLSSLANDDYLLLAGDGVYALKQTAVFASCQTRAKKLLVLADDVHSRLPNYSLPVEAISYAQWVQLSISIGPVVSWY